MKQRSDSFERNTSSTRVLGGTGTGYSTTSGLAGVGWLTAVVAALGCSSSSEPPGTLGPTVVLPPVEQPATMGAAGADPGAAGAGAAVGAPTTATGTATAVEGPTFAEAEVVDPNAETCIELDVQVERLTPTVLLVLDFSGSMSEDFGDSNRWDVLVRTLTDPVEGVLPKFGADIVFGVTTYTSHNGLEDGEECPLMETVPFGATAQSVADFLPTSADLVENSDTPTAESLVAATAMLDGQGNGGPRAIVLATDGNPDDCAEPDAHGPDQRAASVAAVEAAFATGIDTYVISVGDDVALDHLQDLANAGLGAAAGTNVPYYEAQHAASLADAFNDIIFNVTPCEFDLNGTVMAVDAPRGSVVIGGVAAGYDPGGAEGWNMPTPGSVALYGNACDAAKMGALIEITFPCGAFVLE